MVVNRNGPILVEGPVEVLADDGTTARSDRFVAAICTCRRSRTHPWCDTSHRRRTAAGPNGPCAGDRQPQEDEEESRS